MKKHSFVFRKKTLVFSLGFLAFVGCVNVFKISDLSTKMVSESPREGKARDLISQMGTAHGIKNWDDITTYTINVSEEFLGFGGQQENPFKNEITSLAMSYIPNTNNGQIEILSGREIGYIWGIQDNQAYTIFDDELKKTVDKNVKYWVGNYQSILEFPKRIQGATAIAYLGKDTVEGEICDKVLASWNTTKPQNDINQYIIWIDSVTKQITKLEYTQREINQFVIETAYFKNYNEYKGLILPSEIEVESNLYKNKLLHKISIFSFTRNLMHKNTLMPIQEEEEDY